MTHPRGYDPDFDAATNAAAARVRRYLVPRWVDPVELLATKQPMRRPEPPRVERPAVDARKGRSPSNKGTHSLPDITADRIMAMLATGRSKRGIAAELKCSVHTIYQRLRKARGKATRIELETGAVYGQLQVIREGDTREIVTDKRTEQVRCYHCLCLACGRETDVALRELRHSRRKTCGCGKNRPKRKSKGESR